MGDQMLQELRRQFEELAGRLDQVRGAIQEGSSDFVRRRVRALVWSCFVVGVLCIASTVLKTWIGTPNLLDWGLLFVGLVLCIFSLLKKFKVGKEGVEAEVGDVLRVLGQARNLMRTLLQ
jgi:uncharacterized membrane protein YiaA